MPDTTSELRHDRWQDLLLAAGLLALAGAVIEALQLVPTGSPWSGPLAVLRLIGWGTFVAIWFFLAQLVRDPSHELLTAPVVDERVRALRAEAARTALTTVLVVQLVALLVERWLPIRQGDLATLTFAVAQVAMLADFRRRIRR